MNKTLRSLLILALVLTLSVFMIAQSSKGTIAGVITDSSGAVVSGAKITATSADTGENRSATSGPNGEYRLESLSPGTYTVVVEGTGFAKTTLQNLAVRTSQITSNNIQLGLATKQETLVVEASADTVQTETGELSKTIPNADVKDLPISSGNPFALATTLPGVNPPDERDDFTNGAGFSVNGLRPRANNFLIDGFDNNDNSISGQAYQPTNQEAVQEVTVLTNSYGAEYGRGGASVSNLTFKSGSNTPHGGVWYNYDGSRLDALTTQQSLAGNTRVPQYVNHVIGFRAGGPVVKDKLFLFGTSQWTRNFGASSFASTLKLPTENGVAALQSIGPNQNIDYLLQSIGNLRGVGSNLVNVGDRPGCGSPCLIEIGNFVRTDTTASKSYEWTVRADYMPTTTDTVYVRFTNTRGSFAPDLFANSIALPNMDTQQGGPSRLLGSMWAHTFNNTTINEFRFSAQQFDYVFEPTASTLAFPLANMPTFTMASSLGSTFWGGFSRGTFPQGRGHKTFQFQDAVSLNKGTHSFKIGADIAVLLINDTIPFNSNGTINFTKGGPCTSGGVASTCTDFANYIDNFNGLTGTINKQFGNPRLNIPTTQQGYYFQDSWKMRPNLTVNYGIRYEYQPPDSLNGLPNPAINRATVLTDAFTTRYTVKPDRNNWGPRFGFAYTPKWGKGIFGEDKTVIRGGYGMFYDVFFTNISDNVAASAPNTLGGQLTGGPTTRGLSDPLSSVNAVTASVNPLNAVSTVTNDLSNPKIHQWNLGFQRELPMGLLLETAYVGTRGQRLWVNQQFNPKDPNTPGDTRLNPARGSIAPRTNGGDSVYHGLQTSVSRNMKNLTLRAAYTWSRAIDNQSEVFATSGGASRWENLSDPRSDRGPSAFHRTHRFSLAYVYDFPAFKNHGLFTAILGGWSTTGVLSFTTGAPQTIYLGGWDQNGDGEGFNDRPSLGNPAAPLNYSDACYTNLFDPAVAGSGCITGVGFDDGSGSLIDWNTGLPGTANQFKYIVHDFASGVNGNVGRNSFYWPGTQIWNATVRKSFKMPWREGHTLEFRADMFNVLNHPNAGQTNLSNDGDINQQTFMNIGDTRDGGRNIVLWAKYYF